MISFQLMFSLINGTKFKKIKRCNVCAQDIQHSGFAQGLRTNNHLLETGDKLGGNL